jgi:hypothetical protein
VSTPPPTALPPTAPRPPDDTGGGPPTAPSYTVRRVVAAGLALLVLMGLIAAVSALVSDYDTAAPPSTTVEETTTSTAPPPTTTTLAYPRHNDLDQPPVFPVRTPPVRSASEAAPLTVWVVGDSTAQALGELLQNDARNVPSITTRTVFKNSSGLTRKDFYDWPAALSEALAGGAPDAVVISMGDNDAQAIQPVGSSRFYEVGAPEWIAEYTRRLTTFVGQLTAAGSRVYLVGQPVMRDATFDARIAVVDSAYRSVAAADPNVTYVDSRALLSDDAGGYTDRLPGDGGAAVQVRNSDGIHLSLEGARWLARIVARQVAADYGLQAP